MTDSSTPSLTPKTPTLEILAALESIQARLDRLDERIDRLVANQQTQARMVSCEVSNVYDELSAKLDVIWNDLDGDPGTTLGRFNRRPTEYERIGDRLRGRGKWRIPGSFARAAIGTDETMWALRSDDTVHRWDARRGEWTEMPGLLRCITCPTPDIVWGTAGDGSIFRWDGATWQLVPGNLTWISAAADGTVIGCAHDQSIWRLNGPSSWERFPGGLVRICAHSASEMIGIASGDEIFIWTNGEWRQTEGRACDAAIMTAPDGRPVYYVANRAGTVYHLAASQWVPWEKGTAISASGNRLLTQEGDTLYANPEI